MFKKLKGSMVAGGIFFLVFIVFSSFILSNTAHAQTVRITSPNGGEVWTAGENKNITWTFSGAAADAKVELILLQSGKWIGAIASDISIGSGGNGSWTWKVGQYQGGSLTSGSGYKIRMKIVGRGWVKDDSDQPFGIVRASASPSGATATRAPGTEMKPEPSSKTKIQPGSGNVIVEKLPDLTIDRQKYSPYFYTPGKEVIFNIYNLGDSPFEGDIEYYVNSGCAGNIFTIPNVKLNKNEHAKARFPCDFPEPCSHRFFIEIDPHKKIMEARKDNNTFDSLLYRFVLTAFLLEPEHLILRFPRKTETISHQYVIRKSDFAAGIDYDEGTRIARITIGFPIKNCSINGGPDASFVYKIYFVNRGGDKEFIKSSESITNLSLNPGQGGLIEKSIELKARSGGHYLILVYSGESGMEWFFRLRFHDEFF